MSPTPAPFCLQLPTSYVRLFNAVYRQQYRMAAFLAILACSYQMMLHLSSAVADFVPPSSSIPSSPLNSNLLQSRASSYNLFPSTSSSSSFFSSFFSPSSHSFRSTYPPPSSSSSSSSSSAFLALSSSSILPYAVQAALSSLLTEPKTWQLSMTILGIVLQSWILIPPVSADPINFYPRPPPAGWRRGRTSWYGTPKEFVAPYISTRGGGESAFGILEWGGCGYTNSDASLAFNRDEVAAYSDANIDYPGVCGRCYEVKCVNGLVLGRNDTPVDYLHFYYYPKYASVPDSYNRRFPGNIAETNSHVHVQCWDETKSIIVHIIDICPCIYAPQGQKPYEQPSCCGNFSAHPKAGQHQFDLSYWAYEKLAHPMYSEMMLDYRPVDCHTHAPFAPAAYEAPGYINRAVLYDEEPEAGWAWFPYMTPTHNFNVTAKGWGRNGGTAACAELGPGGGMTFLCRNCFMEGYQPFVGVNRIQFWIRNRKQPGTVPTIKAIISNHEAATPTYCKNEVALSNGATGGNVNVVQATENGSDGWMKWDIPFSKWGCYDYGDASRMDKIDFQNYGSSNIWFCLDDLVMERSTGNINLLPPSK